MAVLTAFGNVVPTGLEVWGTTIITAQLGPVPHLPENGRIVAISPKAPMPAVVAAGASMMIDVKRGPGSTLFALAQGGWDGAFEGSPALPGTGQFLRVNGTAGSRRHRRSAPATMTDRCVRETRSRPRPCCSISIASRPT
jgi:hypothetical protein